ncbi:hypothetical protein KY289_036247 [Solanum tuberosum]|nr:hypothetical protein KY289_036247 [Solanum tuberosum]
MSENGTAANIPVAKNVSATVENKSIVSTGDLQHSASTVGHRDIPLGKSLILKDVLHIPKLSANLISIQKLTKDSKCQEQNTNEMIGCASEKGGLYYLDFHNG